MADYLYPDPASMDYFGQYLTPEIYPWLGQGNTGKVNRSAFSPLLFPPERPVTSPIVPAENISRDGNVPPVSLMTTVTPVDVLSDRDRRIQAIDERIANSPIPIQPYVSRKMADTQTNSNSFDNLGSLLFSGGGDGLEGYLSPQQQAAIQRQALMQAAASLLKSSGPSTTPTSFGQMLGGAFEAGTAGYQQAQQGAVNQLITKQKLDEMKRAQAQQQAYQNFLTGQPTVGTEITPQQALSVPGMQVGPTVERAAMIGQPMPSDGTATGGASVLTPMQRAMLAALPAEKGIPELLKITQPTEKARLLSELGLKPTLENLRLLEKPEADPEKIRYLKALNMPITLENLRQLDKPEPLPHEIQLLKATNTPITFENVQAIRKSAAANVNVTQNAQKKGVELAYENAVKQLTASADSARSANNTLQNIERILPALDTAIVGPAADQRTTLLRIGKQLNIAGENADQILRNTAIVVQGLAQQELDAASQMKGQGALTEGERAILRRAAGGDQSLTAGELQQGLMAAQRSARARVSGHQQYLQTAVKAIPDLSPIAPMYEVLPYGQQAPNQFQNAVQQEIDKRKAAGGQR